MKFYLSLPSLFPMGIRKAAPLLKKKGFHGVEIHLFEDFDVEETIKIAEDNGLEVTLHEIWSLEDNPGHLYNHIATFMGKIPKHVIPVSEVMSEISPLRHPVVCYPRALSYMSGVRGAIRDHMWLQTCHTYMKGLTYQEFVDAVVKEKMPVVFDTQHVLEYVHNAHHVDELVCWTSMEHRCELTSRFCQLLPFIREIHFNNFDPCLGKTCGRNMMPHQGVLDLKSFADLVKTSKFNGIVTCEPGPNHLRSHSLPLGLGWGEPRLDELGETLRDYFGE